MTSQRTRDRLIARLREMGIQDERVLDVMRELPRHIFMDEAIASRAYENTALPIGYGQTISQPYIVAKMTELLLKVNPVKVLEVGTGCGYQSAVLARLVKQVFSTERIAPLQEKAKKHLTTLGLYNVYLRHSDGSWGWPENGPYDAIMVTAAPAEVPKALLDQLKVGGRMLIPCGEEGRQVLLQIDKTEDGIQTREIEDVAFVPLLSGVVRS